ncbi:MAG: hypothetical protein R3F13_09615 [Prosthecobacter sp.]
MTSRASDPIRSLSSRACVSTKPAAKKQHCTPRLGTGQRPFCMLCVHCPKCENDPQNSVCELCAACRQCTVQPFDRGC